MIPKVCPSCGEEYVATMERCAACDVTLVAAGEVVFEAPAELPPAAALAQLRVEHPTWIELLAERLAEAGIPSRVELLTTDRPARRGAPAPCALFVRPEDLERARGIDAELLRAQLPDLPDGVDAGWSEAEACPACGTALDAEASECAGCGLAFRDAEE
jgi:predicted amidophosphoribosyltransferase